MTGGAGDDTMETHAASDPGDRYAGGPGRDTIEFLQSDGVTSIDGFPNDKVKGDPSQGVDDIRTDVENVIGGPDDDTITGSATARTRSRPWSGSWGPRSPITSPGRAGPTCSGGEAATTPFGDWGATTR